MSKNKAKNEYDDMSGGADVDDGDNTSLELDPDDELDSGAEGDIYDPVTESGISDEEIEKQDNLDDGIEEKSDYVEDEIDELEDNDLSGDDDSGDNEFDDDDDAQDTNDKKKACKLQKLGSEFIVSGEDDNTMYGKLEYTQVPDEDRQSGDEITYYEIVKVIGIRAQQINRGAICFVKNIKGLTPPQMAYVELMLKMTPFVIKRYLPNKRYEYWKIKELNNYHSITNSYFVPNNIDLEEIRKQQI